MVQMTALAPSSCVSSLFLNPLECQVVVKAPLDELFNDTIEIVIFCVDGFHVVSFCCANLAEYYRSFRDAWAVAARFSALWGDRD
jgi:hypothetical protein